MSTQQPEALRLVEQYDYGDPVAHSNKWKAAACNELRRLHAENAALIMRGKPLHRNWIRHMDTPVFTADQMRTYADATCAMRAQAAPVAQGDAEDAARWRWLRENWFTMTSSYDQQRIRFKVGEPRWSDIAETELDAAIDAARKKGANHDHT